jgi:hypothetical protein
MILATVQSGQLLFTCGGADEMLVWHVDDCIDPVHYVPAIHELAACPRVRQVFLSIDCTQTNTSKC